MKSFLYSKPNDENEKLVVNLCSLLMETVNNFLKSNNFNSSGQLFHVLNTASLGFLGKIFFYLASALDLNADPLQIQRFLDENLELFKSYLKEIEKEFS
jgi:hypothetical protein